MKWFVILGLALGSLVVFQPILNRLILENRGLTFAIWLNGTVLLSLASLLCLIILYQPERFPEIMRFKESGPFSWWYLLPGFFGLVIVTGVPLLIRNLGAFSTVMLMLCGQIATSFLWDMLVNGQAFSGARLLGVMLAFTGAYLSFK